MKRLAHLYLITILILILFMGVVSMARGHEDWFINKAAFGKALSDVGELAARFGVPYSFTRSGKVIYSDGFEASLSPWQIAVGAGFGTVEIVTDVSYRGVNCLKMTPAAAGVQLSRAQKFIPYALSGKIGIEALVWGTTDADFAWLRLGIRKNGVFSYYVFHFDFPTGKLYYLDSGNAKALAYEMGNSFLSDDGSFNLMKLVIDPSITTYDYIQINNTRVPLSGISPYSFANPAQDIILVGLFAEDADGDQGVIYFDDITVTIDEP